MRPAPRTGPQHDATRGMTGRWGLTLGTACGDGQAWVMSRLADARIAEVDVAGSRSGFRSFARPTDPMLAISAG